MSKYLNDKIVNELVKTAKLESFEIMVNDVYNLIDLETDQESKEDKFELMKALISKVQSKLIGK
jgi:tellurite resistance protein